MKRWTSLLILTILVIISINICVIQSTQCFRYQNPRKRNIAVRTNCDDPKLDRVIEAFIDAGSILSSVLYLRSSIVVNISAYDFCADDPLCNGDYAYDPGYAQPTLLYLLKDDDGVERLYPQSLVKQFNFSSDPEYNYPDIYGEFNLGLNYWFKDDPPIKYNQYDFLGLILHELCHGLGFQTSWSTWSPDESAQYITPMLMTEEDYEYLWEDRYDPNKRVSWMGFRENIFDKYLVFTNTGNYVSNKTALLNEFFSNDIKGSYYDFQQKFMSSPQYAIAKDMMNISTQPQTLGLVNWNLTSHHTQGAFNISDLFVVDTTSSVFDPYNSINHVDFTIYTNTSDFLMRNQLFPGETLSGDIMLGGKFHNGQLVGAIGPKLKRFFETMGYGTYSRPNHSYMPKLELAPININSGTAAVEIQIHLLVQIRRNSAIAADNTEI
ncbi:13491_t:CDS:2 [Cetraspora pellucida]|uniref:13491_t:CDS:1 n=1 Tax=Cetraspora pellucida TaxID=1433469 RepID=A0A9N8VU52_9GLOM|nr:13491_t:CDS:2 [Cetraspora pellucida]